MNKIHCYVCGRDIGRYGWAEHVAMEKRKHGPDIYIKLREERERIKQQQERRIKAREVLQQDHIQFELDGFIENPDARFRS